MDNISISIVIYHNYDDVYKLLDSIEKQTSKKIRKTVYLIDNSNPSYSESKTIQNRTKIYSNIEYINTKENLGFGKGHNKVIDKINSNYHAIVNPDVLLCNDVFSSVIEFMDNNPDVGMCIPRITDENGNCLQVYREEPTIIDMFIRMFLKNIFKKRQEKHTLQNMDYSQPFNVPFGQGSFLVIKTELFKSLNGFDERFFIYMEDADLCKRVNQVSKLMYCPYATVIHKWERGSHKNKILFFYHLLSMMKYFEKWGYKWL